MDRNKLRDTVFIGVVEDNQDPGRHGRVKVRVASVYDDIPTSDIPWARPWKDLNGNQFNVPEVGKVVSVVFDDGDIYTPEYIYAQHYNINLETKLSKLSDSTYTSMKGLMFDHKTQIFSNDDDGLVIDYKYNNINIKESTIDVTLKDNYSKLSLGDPNANQQAILGTNFLDWFDTLIDNLLGSKGGPYLGNLGAQVIANPDLIDCLNQYKKLRDPKFLSNNVYIAENYKINSVLNNKDKRINIPQKGDNITTNISTVGATMETGDFTPAYDPNNDANVANDPTYNPNVRSAVTSQEALKTISTISSEFPNANASDFAKRLVSVARTQVGVVEVPKDSNTGPEVKMYQSATGLKGTGFAWCAAFVCWCFKEASNGAQYNFKLPTTAGAFDYENWARNNSSKGVTILKPPFTNIIPGDILIFNFSHIGLSNGVLKNGKIDTIEGNTSAGSGNIQSQREGGGVWKKNRNISLIKTVIRVA
jgi:Type VI secretion system/phage-baseplate injector OB domain/CHAP domain